MANLAASSSEAKPPPSTSAARAARFPLAMPTVFLSALMALVLPRCKFRVPCGAPLQTPLTTQSTFELLARQTWRQFVLIDKQHHLLCHGRQRSDNVSRVSPVQTSKW